MPKTAFAGLLPAEFLRRHWQKEPLLARNALPQFARLVRRDDLFALAARDDVESRLVRRRGRRWSVEHGPFDRRALARLPRSGWTLLVQGVERAMPAAWRLIDAFSFIPYGRLDDLMVSYAPPGGGVGPHYDDYDVVLVQGEGRRRWRVSRQRDLDLVPGAPLRLLRRFRPAREWVLEPGDALYLPPRCAHDGVAVGGGCITYSIGFRAPAAQETAVRFLEFLQDRLRLSGRYADPELAPARRPARIGNDMVRKVRDLLGRIRWDTRDIALFLGCTLTEPKAQVLFSRPPRPASKPTFVARAERRGIRLAGPTRMLFHDRTVFINGEAHPAARREAALLSRLADRRSLPPLRRVGRAAGELLYEWYRAGYIEIGER
jgi:50S ribosomal protein L16 3-hydroxylase